MSSRHTLILGALLAAAGVALGAYGAHGLEDKLVALGYDAELPDGDLLQRMAWFETGVKYQLYHALGLVVVSILAGRAVERESACRLSTASWVSIAFLIGILLFSGSLYAMTFLSSDWKKLGAVVPLGGLAYIVGWLGIAYGACRCRDV